MDEVLAAHRAFASNPEADDNSCVILVAVSRPDLWLNLHDFEYDDSCQDASDSKTAGLAVHSPERSHAALHTVRASWHENFTAPCLPAGHAFPRIWCHT